MPRITTNGIDLAYQVEGVAGDPRLVNGLADTKETWELQLAALTERYRVVAYDNRGVGESSTPPGP
jgi:pimeloyl-ACP methyl ester carboxylesterase